jgi:hypothetical protein
MAARSRFQAGGWSSILTMPVRPTTPAALAAACLSALIGLPGRAQEPLAPAAPSPQAQQQPATGLVWELVTPEQAAAPASAPGEQQQLLQPGDQASAGLQWERVQPGEDVSPTDVAEEIKATESARASAIAAATAPPAPPTWIIGVGGGARIGVGEPTYGMVYGRVGYTLSEDLAISLRPGYVFGNSDQLGEANNEGALQLPLTLDFAPHSTISPYIGLGIATNTDSNGSTDLLLSAGIDIKVTRNISLAAGVNVISQSDDQDNRDVEGITVLYLRF